MQNLVNAVSYLDGVYARVDDELEVSGLEIIGELPAQLDGMFVQNSPNPRFPPKGAYHWFDGDGMVHAVQIRDGQATYRNRYIQTAGLAADEAAGESLTRGLLEPFDPARTDEADKNTANTDLIWHGDQLLATWWLGGAPYALQVPDLATIGPVDFGGTLRGGVSAHPKVDPVTGELIFYDYNVYGPPYLQYGVVSADGRLSHHTTIEIPGARLFHDIAITEKHSIFFDLPMIWDPVKLQQGKRRVRFHKGMPSRFGILPRHADGAEIRWFEAPPCYMYHAVNAWEATNDRGQTVVVLIGCRIEDPLPSVPHEREPTVPRLYFLRMDPYLCRWTFNLHTGAVTEERLDDTPTEFPRMNDDYLGRAARYGYHQRVAQAPTLYFDGVVKYDFQRGESLFHGYGEGRVGAETVFVPRTNPAGEDDGFVVTFVADARTGASELVVIDALDFDGAPVARVKMPRRVPFGFHAHWVPGVGIPRP
jgi:carotenoid cleavage dioxygenase-like enzyme